MSRYMYTRTDKPNFQKATSYLFSFSDPIRTRVKDGLDKIHSLTKTLYDLFGSVIIPTNYEWDARDFELYEEVKDELIRTSQMDYIRSNLFFVSTLFFLKDKRSEVSDVIQRWVDGYCDPSSCETPADLADMVYFGAFRPNQVGYCLSGLLIFLSSLYFSSFLSLYILLVFRTQPVFLTPTDYCPDE